jgi:hypothetical protein
VNLEESFFWTNWLGETENGGVEEGQDDNAVPQLQHRSMNRNAGLAILAGQHEMRREMGQVRSEVDVMGEN